MVGVESAAVAAYANAPEISPLAFAPFVVPPARQARLCLVPPDGVFKVILAVVAVHLLLKKRVF